MYWYRDAQNEKNNNFIKAYVEILPNCMLNKHSPNDSKGVMKRPKHDLNQPRGRGLILLQGIQISGHAMDSHTGLFVQLSKSLHHSGLLEIILNTIDVIPKSFSVLSDTKPEPTNQNLSLRRCPPHLHASNARGIEFVFLFD